ncbi:branched-chain amino acid ABC transporter permease [Variovorax sp. PBL-E5]|uniref:branched-chain amino acid ABC transporter permease n=1 Tax=Variovorax sp. PBL-E5 TaxID=434014 RepID=UPI001318CC8B|nr:branched-chain amino acid ABC transporter permease [Variovorax sp. PBL-E5]VTU37603.1 leucine/isoleucine/valine transporter permease subunit [Variovorax sp. PBL-E5]
MKQGLGSDLHRPLIVLLAAAALLAPLVFYPVFLMKALCFALFACAFNLLVGYTGLMSFGHAAFFGMGSYVTAHAMKNWGVTPELALLASIAANALLGLVFGWLSVRRVGIYFSMVTLALSQIVYFYALQAPWTGGEDGIQGVPRGALFGFIDLRDSFHLYYFVLAVFVAGFALIQRTVHSPFGHVLKGIRENEVRALSLGYRVERYKILAFTISAALSGLAGATKCLVFESASLGDIYWPMSGEVVLMTLIGGMGLLWGPVVGAFVLVAMGLYLAQFGAWLTVIEGLIFVVCVLCFRSGLAGPVAALLERLRTPPRARPMKAAASPIETAADVPPLN